MGFAARWMQNTSEQKRPPMNSKSVQEVSKQGKARFAKSDARYWTPRLFRNSFTRDGERHKTADWCIKIAHAGRRETINLRTPNQITAGTKAAGIFKLLVGSGWAAVLAEHKPKAAPAVEKAATVGDLIREVGATVGFRPSTFTAYTQSLRTVSAGIAGISDQPALDENGKPKVDRKKRPVMLSRHDTFTGGRDAWRARVDALTLDTLTPDRIQKWRLAHVAKVGSAPDARKRAENTASSLLRNARALFSEKALKFARANLRLPEPLPFTGVKLPKPSSRYVSRIDARTLIADARKELAAVPGRLEQFKLFCLAMVCGLRKAEADTLIWSQVDFTGAQICIEPTKYFTPKSDDSIGAVDLDPEMVALLRGWKARAKGEFVVESSVAPRYHEVSRRWYRCEHDFRELYAWLKSKGVNARKPLHELRKEVGAILASEQGIFAAQRVLRHAQISTTAEYYTDKKQRITAGLGSLLAGKGGTIPSPSPDTRARAGAARRKATA